MQLTFSNRQFVLKNITANVDLRTKEGYWQHLGAGLFSTTNLKAALAFRAFSDKAAEKVFKRSLPVYYKLPCLPPLSFLDPHQREGVEWILTRSRSYLAHAPGAGKTCQAIVASLLVAKCQTTLFIVPPTLTLNWAREIAHFSKLMGITSSVSIVPLSSDKESMDWKADFIICPDSMLTKEWVYYELLRLNPKFIAVDEASRFKDPLSQRSKAFYGGIHDGAIYHGLFQGVRHVVFLDGSPMPNRPMELWAPCFALNPASIDYLDYVQFGFRYCGATLNKFNEWEFRHSSHEAELKEKIQKNFMHVVTEDKLSHPERRRSILYINEKNTIDVKKWDNLPKNFDESKSVGELAKARKEIGLFKTKWASRYITERLQSNDESILLFAWHREVCEILATKLQNFNPEIIYGGIKNEKREKVFRDFQSRKTRLIIGNIQAMGRGHNLQEADRIVFAEYSWSSELNLQCEKRSSRRGNKKTFIRCEYLVLPDSLDEVVLTSVMTKEQRIKEIIG